MLVFWWLVPDEIVDAVAMVEVTVAATEPVNVKDAKLLFAMPPIVKTPVVPVLAFAIVMFATESVSVVMVIACVPL